GKQRETARTVTRQSAFAKWNPQISGSVFTKVVGPGEWAQAIGFRVTVEAFGRSLPSGEYFAHRRKAGNPDVAARVFKQSSQVIVCQAILRGIDGLGTCRCKFLQPADFGKPVQTRASAHPPFARAVLKHEVAGKAPEHVGDSVGEIKFDGDKLVSIQPADLPFAAHKQFA